MAYLYLLMVVWVVLQVFLACKSISVVVIELWAVEAFVFRLLLLLALRKQLLCAFLSLIFLCGMMPCNIRVCQAIFMVGVLSMLEMQVSCGLKLDIAMLQRQD
jgi:hypothetical protein